LLLLSSHPFPDALKKYPGSVISSYGISTVSNLSENNPAAFLKDSIPFSQVGIILGSDRFVSK
jgi:hypothetical protein